MKFETTLAAGFVELIRSWTATKSGNFYLLAFFGAILLVALMVFGWVVVSRKDGGQQKHRRHSHRDKSTEHEGADSAKGKRRKRRRNHRPLNPTLAETGGLPEPRDQRTPPPV